MSRRSKTALEAKIRAIESYSQGTETSARLAAELKVDPVTIRRWNKRYGSMGLEGIREHPKNGSYTKEFKIGAVEAYLRGEGSLSEISDSWGIVSRSRLPEWIKKYNSHEEIRDYDPKGDVYMTKGRATTKEERIEIVQWCLRHEKSYKLAAEKYGVSYGQVYAWVSKYLAKGESGLTDSRGRRKPEAELSPEEKQTRELERLKAENENLKLEIELRKKVEEIERRLYSEKYGRKRNI